MRNKKDIPPNTIGGLNRHTMTKPHQNNKGNSLKYSIDKLKIEFQYIKRDVVQSFLNKIMNFSYNFDYTSYFESKKVTECKHNFRYGDGEGAIYLGIVPNWRKEEVFDKNIILEYNPNKVYPFAFDIFAWLLKLPTISWRIMSFDIAVDMLIPYNTVCMLKRDKREEIGTRGHGVVETQYLGALGNGHIKLYDKAKEQKVDNVDWTRFEITIKKINHLDATLDDFKEVCKLPVLYRKDVQLSALNVNDIWRLALEHVINEPTSLYTMVNLNSRKKMEQLMFECLEDIPLSVDDMYKTYINFFKDLDLNIDVNSDTDFDFWGCMNVQEDRKERVNRYFRSKNKHN